MGASFEEKKVWIQFAGMAVALGGYFAVAASLLAQGVRALPAFAALFMIATAAMVFMLLVGLAIAAITGRADAPDERDRSIAWRAEHNSSWVLALGVFAAVACMLVGVDNAWSANILLLALFLSQTLAFGLQILYYRRGMGGA